MKKVGLLVALITIGRLQAMNFTEIVHARNLNVINYSSVPGQDYVIKKTGLGETATTEVIYDPVTAEMMREMKKAEIACYARQAAEQKEQADKKAAEQKQAEASFGKGFKKGFFGKK